MFNSNRREFMKQLAVAPVMLRLGVAGQLSLRVSVLYEAVANDVLAGVRLGATEAQRAAQLLGGVIDVAEAEITRDVTDARLTNEGAAVVIAACTPAALEVLEPQLGSVVIVNAFAGAGSLSERLRARCWHIAADDAQANALWRANLERFGAAQLNARFQAMHRRQMTANAWAGWFSVKVAWEAALRTRTTQPERIEAFLASGAAFDGHKGEPLMFDPATRVLQQPLYAEVSE